MHRADTTQLLPPVDVAVIGAGAAGLYAALTAAEAGASVRLISASPLDQSASYRAQGGLAAALDPSDSPQLHLEDTLTAGRGAVRASAARILCEQAPERVRELERRGVPFDRDPGGELALGLEGGHRRRRVVHAGGSATGRRVAETLSRAAVEDRRIEVHERCFALRLWTSDGRCSGAVTDAGAMPAAATLLATGGAAALWKRTTNPPGAVGTGLLLAHDAGAELADLELLQFHPTALVADGELDGFLITEAVRGEGARLLNCEGERFVDELAPRDEVTQAIDEQLRRSGAAAVSLDLRDIEVERFPNIVEALARAGIEPHRDLVPVAPAAHYMIGGVRTDLAGRSTLPGLYAIGECGCAGVHGANRLASNSLSECFVFGRLAALVAVHEPPVRVDSAPPAATALPRPDQRTRSSLWSGAGMVRDAAGLARLGDAEHPLARLVGGSALAREESRGCHIRSDFPLTDPGLDEHHLVVAPEASEPRPERWS